MKNTVFYLGGFIGVTKMEPNRKKYLVLVSLALLISVTLPVLNACEPGYEIKVENSTEQVLTIYYDVGRTGYFVTLGDVESGEYIYTPDFWINDGYCQIDAKNMEGELIFSREFTWWEMRDDYKFVVVITPPRED